MSAASTLTSGRIPKSSSQQDLNWTQEEKNYIHFLCLIYFRRLLYHLIQIALADIQDVGLI